MNNVEDNFIVAIELGSSKVTGLAGKKEPDGTIRILAHTIVNDASGFIRKGRIYNQNKTKSCIKNIKEALEKTLNNTISQVYVGIGGMGMRTTAYTVSRNFHEKTIITEQIIDLMKDDNLQSQTQAYQILEAVPQEYKLGTQFQLEPVGVSAENVEGHFLNIITKKEVKETIYNCFHDAGLEVVDVPIAFMTLAKKMLNESVRRSGCVFVDMGAETTSVAVFKNNILRHLAVLPLGGRNITQDIASLQVEEEEAERLKRKYGKAIAETDGSESPIQFADKRTVSYEDFIGLVTARQEEIIENINRQIELSNLDKSKLIGGLIVTGGAANMKDMEKALEKQTTFTKISIIDKLSIPTRTKSSVKDFNAKGEFNGAVALLEKGEVNCCGGQPESKTLFANEEKELSKPAVEVNEKTGNEAPQTNEEKEENNNLEKAKETLGSQKTENIKAEEFEKEDKAKSGKFKKWMQKAKNVFDTILNQEEN